MRLAGAQAWEQLFGCITGPAIQSASMADPVGASRADPSREARGGGQAIRPRSGPGPTVPVARAGSLQDQFTVCRPR